MKRIALVAALGVASLLAGFAHAEAPAPKGAEAVDRAWEKAMTANDLDAIVACYAKDAVFWMANTPEARGHEAIRAVYVGLLSDHVVTGAKLESARYESAGDVSVGWGEYSVSLEPKAGGDPVVVSGRFTVVAKEEGGRWVYVVDHASAPPAPAPPAGEPK